MKAFFAMLIEQLPVLVTLALVVACLSAWGGIISDRVEKSNLRQGDAASLARALRSMK